MFVSGAFDVSRPDVELDKRADNLCAIVHWITAGDSEAVGSEAVLVAIST